MAELGKRSESIVLLKQASLLNPDDKSIIKELSKQQSKLKQENKSEQNMYRRMIGTDKDNISNSTTKKSGKSWVSIPIKKYTYKFISMFKMSNDFYPDIDIK